jgi:hypothetical protein
VWAQARRPKVVFDFTVLAGKVTRIDMISDEDVLDELNIEYLRHQKGG